VWRVHSVTMTGNQAVFYAPNTQTFTINSFFTPAASGAIFLSASGVAEIKVLRSVNNLVLGHGFATGRPGA
jgi:hypothetical protein